MTIFNIILITLAVAYVGYFIYKAVKENNKIKKKNNLRTNNLRTEPEPPAYYADTVSEKSYEDETPSLRDVKRVLKHIRK